MHPIWAERPPVGVAGDPPIPAVRRLLPDRVYQSLLRQILAGEMRPDERLPSEHQLAAQFLVSRPVVREALQHLREEKPIFSRRGAGRFVCPGVAPSPVRQPALGFAPVETIADIQRCYEFRLTIEPEQVYRAARRWNPKIRTTLRARSASRLDRVQTRPRLLRGCHAPA